MSEHGKELLDDAELQSIKFEEVRTFFEEIGVSEFCPACKNTDWDISVGATDDDNHEIQVTLPMIRAVDATGFDTQHLPCVAAVCNNCGFIRLHAKLTFLRWKKKKVIAAKGGKND